jgi:hypothetical protein
MRRFARSLIDPGSISEFPFSPGRRPLLLESISPALLADAEEADSRQDSDRRRDARQLFILVRSANK